MTANRAPLPRTDPALLPGNTVYVPGEAADHIRIGDRPDSLVKEQGSGRDDDWAVSGDRCRQALEAAEAGTLRFHQSPVYGYVYLSNGTGERPTPEVWPETVQRLVSDGMLDQDTTEGLYRPGQLLSLTPRGEAALRDARTSSPRVSAALSRSNAAAITDAASPAARAVSSATANPSRSR